MVDRISLCAGTQFVRPRLAATQLGTPVTLSRPSTPGEVQSLLTDEP